MKKIVCLLLSLCLCVVMVAPAMAVGTATTGNFWELVSLTRNTSVNERDNPFDSGKTATIEWEDGSEEVEYSVVTQNTFWTLTSTGVDSGYNVAQYSIVWYHQNSVGNYESEGGGLGGESELPMTVRFNSSAFQGENTDTGSGEYLYQLYFDVYNFFLEDAEPVEYSFYFIWNEAEANRIQAEIDNGGQTPANIVGQGTCGDNLTWTLDSSGVLSINGTGAMSNYTKIEDHAPWHNNSMSIHTVSIGEGVTTIGDRAFAYCTNLNSLSISDSVTVIKHEAFYECDSLTSVTIPNSVTTIGDGAFAYCDRLTDVTIPNSISSIEDGAFYGCSALTNVTIPSNVTNIGAKPFADCSQLSTITVASDNTKYVSIEGVLFNLEKTRLIQYPAGKNNTSYVIPDSVTTIMKDAFVGCSHLVCVTIPKSVTTIGVWAFNNCTSLTDVYYGGTEGQWSVLASNGIDSSGNTPLLKAFIHYNFTDPDSAPAPAFSSPSAPTVSGGAAITRANVGQLTEITVPVTYSGSTAQTVTFAVPFFDGNGKFIGVGMTTETVTSSTQSVTVPVRGLSGSERMKVLILTENFCPLSSAGSYDIPA